MVSLLVELKLSAALKQRLSIIAEAGVLGRTVDEVVAHFTREALHRDWLAREVQQASVAIPVAPPPSPPVPPKASQGAHEYGQRFEKRLVRIHEVCSRIGVCRSTLYRMVSLKTFPPPKQLGARSVAWLETDLDAWIDSRSSGGHR